MATFTPSVWNPSTGQPGLLKSGDSLGGVTPGTAAGEVVSYDTTGQVPLFGALNEAPTVTLASAATVNIGAAAANKIIVTGTTAITGFDAVASGAFRRVEFAGVLTLTHNATSLILPGAANITTAAGDVAYFTSLGSGNWKCEVYSRASGAAVAGGGGGGGPAGANTQIQYNDNGAFGASADLTYNSATKTALIGDLIVSAPSNTVTLAPDGTPSVNIAVTTIDNPASTSSGSVTIRSGNQNFTGFGTGPVIVQSGTTSATATTSGPVTIASGDSASSSGVVTIQSGTPGTAAGRTSGNVVVASRAASGSASSGSLTLRTGDAGAAVGNLLIATGSSTGSGGGALNVSLGASGAGNGAVGSFIIAAAAGGGTGGTWNFTSGAGGPTGPGGAINLTTGAGGSTSGDAGDMVLSSGTVTGASNRRGKLRLVNMAIDESLGAAIASSASISIGLAPTGNFFDITGTTAITTFTPNATQAGPQRQVRFTGSLTLTNGGTIILPLGQNIITENGDIATFRAITSGTWLLTGYHRPSTFPITRTVTTTNATATTIISFPTTAGTAYDIQCRVVGRRTAGGTAGSHASYLLTASGANEAGTLTLTGITTTPRGETDAAWNAEIIGVSPNLGVQVSGAGGVTINWKAEMTLLSVQ